MTTDGAEERLLQLLQNDDPQQLTLEALRAHGFEAPAQAIYMLQLDGYAIDFVPIHRADGKVSRSYRMRPACASESQRSSSASSQPGSP